MPCVEIDDKLYAALQREAEKRGETPQQTLRRILELYFGYGEEEEKEVLRRLRDLGYA
jgi:negative regulator of replication initiation